jgi:hypothetical protein
MTLQKISFKVPPGLWESFGKQASALFLARAPFLNHMIAQEAKELAKDLGGRRLSLRGKRHISGMLKQQGAKSVNIEVEAGTAAMLNTVVQDCNLVRDAFLCRMIIFLRGSDWLLNYLEVPLEVREGGGREGMPTSPMKAMEALRDDPLYYIRVHVQENWNLGIYAVRLPPTLDWAACYLEDSEVPGTKAFKKEKQEMAEAFELLERDAFTPTSKVSNGRGA